MKTKKQGNNWTAYYDPDTKRYFAEMKKQGAAAVHLAVAKENVPAIRLYQKTGFVFCGEAFLYGHRFFLCEKAL